MRIGPVTVRAILIWQRLFEIPSGVALHAIHLSMPAKERKFRLGMVERAIQRRCRDLLPARGAVTGLAGLGKTTTVRIRVAIRATAECNSGVARLFVLPGSVALLARDLGMQTSQRIARHRMVERAETDRFPVSVIVTLQAVGSELSVVFVTMAAAAARGQTQKRSAQISCFDDRAFARRHALWPVTLVAFQPGVFALQPVAGLRVIESLAIPLDEGKIFFVVLGVALRAFQTGTWLEIVGGVQSPSRHNSPRNFTVTIQTLECGFPGRELVAGGALGHATDGLVRAGKRAGRDLGCDRIRGPQDTQHNPPQKYRLRESANTLREARFQNHDVRFDVTAAR